jgi:hypothetical protein
VRGSISASEMLMRGGADPRLADLKQYTVVHVAAQYGQTAFLYHMALKWGVDIDLCGPTKKQSQPATPLQFPQRRDFSVCKSLITSTHMSYTYQASLHGHSEVIETHMCCICFKRSCEGSRLCRSSVIGLDLSPGRHCMRGKKAENHLMPHEGSEPRTMAH